MIQKPFYLFLFFGIAGLLLTSGTLLKQSKDCKSINRKLILQNDSLQAVIISLTHQLGDSKPAKPPKKNVAQQKAQ